MERADPALTFLSDGTLVVAYTRGSGADTDIIASIITTGGEAGPEFAIHDETDNSGNVELATLSNGNWVAVFQDEFNGNATDIDVRFRIFTATGMPVTESLSSPGAFGNAAETDPDVAALTGGDFVVVWTDADSTLSDIRAAIFTDAGGIVADNILVNATQAGAQNEASVVGLLDGGFLVTWEDDNANLVRAQRFDAAGNALGDHFTVHTEVSGASSPEAARLLDGRIAYVFDDFVGGDYDVFTSIWNPRGTVAAIGDVLWQQADGTVAIAARELAQASAGWQTQGVGDFDGDGDGDVLWRHRDGAVVTWELEDGQLLTNHNIAFASVGWEVVNTGDFDADGDADVLWRHRDGAVVTWEMENGGYVQNHNIEFASVGWTMQGVGDFDADGDDDVIWRHRDGAVVTWEMENGGYVVNHNIEFASVGWTIRGTGDVDGDGDDDILWHHNDGALVAWEMENGAYIANRNIDVASASWQIRGVWDFDSDGDADILWRHNDGSVVTWELENAAHVANHVFGVTGNDWQIRGIGEFGLA
jgi:FG-GAP-like repeat